MVVVDVGPWTQDQQQQVDFRAGGENEYRLKGIQAWSERSPWTSGQSAPKKSHLTSILESALSKPGSFSPPGCAIRLSAWPVSDSAQICVPSSHVAQLTHT